MAASSTTCFASWQRKQMGVQARNLTIAVAASLALAGCNVDAAPSAAEKAEVVPAAASVIDLSVADLAALQAESDVRLIDVRTAEEVAEGAIPGAEHIALDEFDPAALNFSDGREVVLYCRSGRRSRIAGEALSAHTGEPAKHLAGGINAWREAQSTD